MSAARAMTPVLDWRPSDDNDRALDADIDGAYCMTVEPDSDENTVDWQVWHSPERNGSDGYTVGTEPTVERAQCAAEACALEHARRVVARLERRS